ncbi:Dynein heavy chain 1 [Phytophthora cinnamomi]|uniref:Dynein heavy chain 1 n=1 Tax=Phytophthora cinnamomi TaxID=4785 RepID=UPI00355A9B2A|nr:Dynein heavy chain 1 [Phytophthora cinnamomi]
MALLQGDDDDKVFEATMSFIDEFPFDEPEPEAALAAKASASEAPAHADPNPAPNGAIDVVELLRVHDGHAATSTASSKVPSILSLDTTGMTRREKIVARNARKKLLRKAGIYGDSNRVRNERKLEIAYLRDRIEKLQIDLKTLQTHKDGQPKPPRLTQQLEVQYLPTNTLVVAMTNSISPISSVWQEIADRQQRRRKEAERENIRLKLVMERQRKVANTLSSLLQKRASQLENDCSCFSSLNCPKHQIVHVLDYHGDISSFQGLFRHLEAAYHDIDAVFAANGLSSMVITPSDVHIRQGVGGTDKHLGNGSLYSKAKRDLDEPYTVIEEFTKEVFSNSSRADVKMKQVVRRFVEPGRDIVIWVASVAPTEIKHKMLKGLTYHLRGYALTKRSAASTPGQELSQLQFCYLISLDQDIEAMYGVDNMRALTNFLIVNTAQNMRVHQSGIENRLIDQALRSKLTKVSARVLFAGIVHMVGSTSHLLSLVFRWYCSLQSID